jgi:hypothetical protein
MLQRVLAGYQQRLGLEHRKTASAARRLRKLQRDRKLS